MHRKSMYLQWVYNALPRLEELQNGEGCFFAPYWKKQKNYMNARWQEAALTFAWLSKKHPVYKKRVVDALNYWCTLQTRSGSFPEYSKYDRSFSATAFTSLAVVEISKYVSLTQQHLSVLLKAADWLVKNDETVFTNQEAVAYIALLKIFKLTKQEKYFNAAEKKLLKILKNQAQGGYYLEKKGFDLGYSSLTLEMLGLAYLETQDQRLLNSAEKFITFIATGELPGKNVRETRWVIADGFEIFANKTVHGKQALKKILEQYNVKHLEQDINFCTDLYRHCWAYDHASVTLPSFSLKEDAPPLQLLKRPRFLNILRPFGLHRIRKVIP